MTTSAEPLPAFLAGPPRLGTEISVTGTWTPKRRGGRFRTTPDAAAMVADWEDALASARDDDGVLSMEIDPVVGSDAVLVHRVFADADAAVAHLGDAEHHQARAEVARPGLHLIRGAELPTTARDAIGSTSVPVVFGEWSFGYVRDDHHRPDPATAVQVTAKWTCAEPGHLGELAAAWQRVGTDAHSIEPGLVRFEAYRVPGEDALVIHETFTDSAHLRFHLTKGTAATYKRDIDRIAAPDEYYFRGPVAWSIRTYSRFMRLPATYASRGRVHARDSGSFSDGLIG